LIGGAGKRSMDIPLLLMLDYGGTNHPYVGESSHAFTFQHQYPHLGPT